MAFAFIGWQRVNCCFHRAIHVFYNTLTMCNHSENKTTIYTHSSFSRVADVFHVHRQFTVFLSMDVGMSKTSDQFIQTKLHMFT